MSWLRQGLMELLLPHLLGKLFTTTACTTPVIINEAVVGTLLAAVLEIVLKAVGYGDCI